MDGLVKRVALSIVTAALALVVIEGGLSLATGRSLRDAPRLAGRAPSPPPLTDADRREGARDPRSLYSSHEDPLVRYVLRRNAELSIFDGVIHSDALGMRVRPGGEPPQDALRVVVLGDSMAFGYGVDDHETLAARLESALAASRGPDARPVACRTVAIPSWNHRCALRFLVDHYDEYRPDVVIYMPISNDLSDGNSLYMSGFLRQDPDPSSPDPFLLVGLDQHAQVQQFALERLDPSVPRDAASIDALFGPYALTADLSPESTRRFDENVGSILELERYVGARGGRLLVLHQRVGQYVWHLRTRLAERGSRAPFLVLMKDMLRSFKLPRDPHPNAATLEVWAGWVAQELVRLGWVDAGAGRPWPEAPDVYRDLRAPALTERQFDRLARSARATCLAALRNAVVVGQGLGLRQVYGGLNVDGSVKTGLRLMLRADGPTVNVRLEALPTRPDLYPLRVDVEFQGRPAGQVVVEPTGVASGSFDVPPDVARGAALEVALRPERWCVVLERGRSQVASFVPLAISCPEP